MKAEVEFDADGLAARIARAGRDFLRRAGAYVRRVAQRKVATSPRASPPGSPPHSRRGLLRRAVLFGSDGDKRVLVGPGFTFVGTSASAHEFGGKYRRERYPKRPLMGPALRESAPHLAKMWQDAVK